MTTFGPTRCDQKMSSLEGCSTSQRLNSSRTFDVRHSTADRQRRWGCTFTRSRTPCSIRRGRKDRDGEPYGTDDGPFLRLERSATILETDRTCGDAWAADGRGTDRSSPTDIPAVSADEAGQESLVRQFCEDSVLVASAWHDLRCVFCVSFVFFGGAHWSGRSSRALCSLGDPERHPQVTVAICRGAYAAATVMAIDRTVR